MVVAPILKFFDVVHNESFRVNKKSSYKNKALKSQMQAPSWLLSNQDSKTRNEESRTKKQEPKNQEQEKNKKQTL
jgi:hypothetical protein